MEELQRADEEVADDASDQEIGGKQDQLFFYQLKFLSVQDYDVL